jgi:uncharacterized protein (DUF58 family)
VALTAEEIRQIRSLQIQLNRKVDSPFSGQYRSAFRGQGMEFDQVRPYVPGDDIRHIDWNVTARTQSPFVKQFREERELNLLLMLDVSGSMCFGSGGQDGRTDKRLQVARLAGALAYAGIRNRDHVGLLAFTDQVEHYLPPRRSRGHAWAVIRAAFEHQALHRRTDLSRVLESTGQILKRRSVICILSDFDSPDGPNWERALAVLARRHQVSCFLVHDPMESQPLPAGLLELEDAESGEHRLVDSSTLCPRTPLSQRLSRLRRTGAWSSEISTAVDPFHQLLMHFKRMERAR